MPVKKVRGGYKVVSYVTGKTLKTTYKTKKAAENAKKKFNEIQLNKLQKYTKIISKIKNLFKFKTYHPEKHYFRGENPSDQ